MLHRLIRPLSHGLKSAARINTRRPRIEAQRHPSNLVTYSSKPGGYGRFSRAQRTFNYLRANPRVLVVIGSGTTLFYVFNLETVPGSERRRFNWISPERELWFSQYALESVLQEYDGKILPDSSPEVRLVEKVLERLIPHTGVPNSGNWEVRVIDDPTTNAFVIPGNKVFVFKGMLNITQNEDGLATVLGHEIAHNIAHHTGENISRASLVLPLFLALTLFVDVSAQFSSLLLHILIQAPGSRKQESEADYLGLLMMARSCFNPEEAVHLWERMHAYEQALARSGRGEAPPQFLSTHPSSYNRIQKIKEWLPQALAQSEASDCSQMSSFSEVFRGAWNRQYQDEGFDE